MVWKILIPTMCILFGASIISFIYVLFFNDQPNNGRLVFEVDYDNRKIRFVKHKFMSMSKIPETKRKHNLYSGQWVDLEKFVYLFNDSTQKAIRNVLFDINEDKKINERILLSKRNNSIFGEYEVNSNFQKSSSGFIQVNIQYHKKIDKVQNWNLKKWNKSDLKNKVKNKYLILFAAKVQNDKNLHSEIFREIKFIFKKIKMHFIIEGNTMIVVIPTDSVDKKYDNILKKIPKLKKNLLKRGLAQSYSYVAMHKVDKPESPKEINNILLLIEYLLYKSRITNKIGTYNEAQDDKAFTEFKTSYLIMDQAIRAGDIETGLTRVRNYKTNKPLISYAYPTSSKISNKWLNKLSLSQDFREAMVDAHTSKYINKIKSEPMILDVNQNWLMKNYDKIKNKKIIYCINLSGDTPAHELALIVDALKTKEIYCAIRIMKLNHKTTTLIKSAKPQFLLIDRKLASAAYKREIFSALVDINKMAKSANVKIIYELPSEKLDNRQSEKLGLKFYYNFK